VKLVQREAKVFKALLVQPERKVIKVFRVQLVHKVSKVFKEIRALQELLEPQVHRASKARLVLQVLQEAKVSKEPLVQLERLERHQQ
jgi:hypothetical protein